MYQLPTCFDTIKGQPVNEWKRRVSTQIEKKNKERMLQECHKVIDGRNIPKSKTSTIVDKRNDPNYTRKPATEIMCMNKHETRTLIMSRYGMLECGKNFGGSIKKICERCNCIDDEAHRLNACTKWSNTNLLNCADKVDFNQIYSTNTNSSNV